MTETIAKSGSPALMQDQRCAVHGARNRRIETCVFCRSCGALVARAWRIEPLLVAPDLAGFQGGPKGGGGRKPRAAAQRGPRSLDQKGPRPGKTDPTPAKYRAGPEKRGPIAGPAK